MENRIILSPVTGAAAYTYTDVHAYYTHKILLCTVRESTGVRVRVRFRRQRRTETILFVRKPINRSKENGIRPDFNSVRCHPYPATRRIDNVPRITDPQPNNYPSFAFGTMLKRPDRWTEEEPTNNSIIIKNNITVIRYTVTGTLTLKARALGECRKSVICQGVVITITRT